MKDQYELIMLALCLWREARSRTEEEIRAVACSIRNRLDAKFRGADDYAEVVTERAQYSSFPWFNGKGQPIIDHNGINFPHRGRPEWDKFEMCLAIADQVKNGGTPDSVGGATHYYDKSLDGNPPAWALDPTSRHCADVGDFRFWIAR